MKSYLILVLFFSLIIAAPLMGQPVDKNNNKASKVLVNDHYQYIAINEIKMWISNNGDGSHDPLTDGNGLYWPGGLNATKSAVFEDGLVFGGKYDGEIRVNGNTHRQGLQAGKILPNGTPDDPTLEKYRVYKILKGWELLPPGPLRDAYELDYNEWPIEDGAPYIDVNGNGQPDPGIDTPEYVGDETCWYVSNDMDPSRSTYTYGTLPMGLEFQTTVFGFNTTGPLADVVFKKYKVINKGTKTVEDMYLTYWSDPDLGNSNDDFAGCDSLLNLGFVYNSSDTDLVYGTPPPAVGYDILQGPIVPGNPDDSARFNNGWRKGFKNLPMTAFILYANVPSIYWSDPSQGTPAGSIQFYNYFQGLHKDSSVILDPHTQLASKFVANGDPNTQTGWYEGAGWPACPFGAGDRRIILPAGPFNFAPGDTQEVIYGIVLAQGSSNLNSISALKEKSIAIQDLFDNNFISDVNEYSNEVKSYNLFQNYPNPFNPSTIISFNITSRDFVKVRVYDILGNEIALLVNEVLDQGHHRIQFTPANYIRNLSSSIYFYKIETSAFTETKKMIYLK